VPTFLDRTRQAGDTRAMTTRLQQDVLSGPNGETVRVNWMPNGRLRLDFVGFQTCAVTKIFPDPRKEMTHVEFKYEAEGIVRS
jgi:hypothetical protein